MEVGTESRLKQGDRSPSTEVETESHHLGWRALGGDAGLEGEAATCPVEFRRKAGQ
jgi:hypothetical protein